MDARELENFLTSRGASRECPFCGHDVWSHVRLDVETTLRIPGYTRDRVTHGIEVFVVSCTNCAFMRLHSPEVIRGEAKQLPDD